MFLPTEAQPLGSGVMIDPTRSYPSPLPSLVALQNLVTLCHTMWACVGIQKFASPLSWETWLAP